MNPTIKTTPKDFFFHLGALIALYTSVYALLDLIFSIVNYLTPDQLSNYFTSNSVAWPISTLIILIPVLYILEWLIVKNENLIPEKKNLWVSRWRMYLTVFLSTLILVIDLITLINTYLGGEISSRFIFKVIAVLVVIGAILKYYFFRINDKYRLSKTIRIGHSVFLLVIVIVSIVTGFILVGSPAKQRALRFDNQRITDLQNIQWQVVNYWQQKGKLPITLAVMKDPIAGSAIPNDPENNVEYSYVVKGDKMFSLCATFTLPDQDSQSRPILYGNDTGDNWKHDIGKVCFDRTIDPEKYPPYPGTIKAI